MSTYRLYVSTHAGLPDFDHGEFSTAQAAEAHAATLASGASFKVEGSDGYYSSGKTGAEPTYRSQHAAMGSPAKPKRRLFGGRASAARSHAD